MLVTQSKIPLLKMVNTALPSIKQFRIVTHNIVILNLASNISGGDSVDQPKLLITSCIRTLQDLPLFPRMMNLLP